MSIYSKLESVKSEVSAAEIEIAMKLIITAQGPKMSNSVDPRFGRARYFILVDENALTAWRQGHLSPLARADGTPQH